MNFSIYENRLGWASLGILADVAQNHGCLLSTWYDGGLNFEFWGNANDGSTADEVAEAIWEEINPQ